MRIAMRLGVMVVAVPVLAWLGWIVIQGTRADELADDDPKAALRLEPGHPGALLELGMDQFRAKDFGAAATTARHLLRVEPGQGDAFLIIALAARERGDADAKALTRIALQRSPRSRALRAQATADALMAGDLPEAMTQLDALLRIGTEAPLYPIMAQQADDPRIADAFAAKLSESPPWRDSFLYALGTQGSPKAVDQVYAGLQKRGQLSDRETQGWLDRMMRDGRWKQAHSLWIGMLGDVPDPMPLVYNGSFEHASTDRGFDWRSQRVLGVFSQFEPVPGATGKQAAHFHFIGRPATGGDLNQPLLLAPGGEYRLRLRARGAFLHSDQGLNWTIRCDGGPVIATLGPLEGSFEWRDLSTDFSVPPDGCAGQWLELQNPAVGGSAQQVSGDLWTDAIAIDRL